MLCGFKIVSSQRPGALINTRNCFVYYSLRGDISIRMIQIFSGNPIIGISTNKVGTTGGNVHTNDRIILLKSEYFGWLILTSGALFDW